MVKSSGCRKREQKKVVYDSFDLLIICSPVDNGMFYSVIDGIDKKSDRLLLVLETLGGDINIAFRTMKYLRSLYDNIAVVMPDQAASAGTMMVLGCNEIYMSYSSCIGPLDAQVYCPGVKHKVSAIDIDNYLDDIVYKVAKTKLYFYEVNHFDLKMDPETSALLSCEEVVTLFSDFIKKIDPSCFLENNRLKDVTFEYADILLSKGMLSDENKREKVIEKLVSGYDSHSYAIMFDEVKNTLCLDVKIIDELPEWECVSIYYNDCCGELGEIHEVKFLGGLSRDKSIGIEHRGN